MRSVRVDVIISSKQQLRKHLKSRHGVQDLKEPPGSHGGVIRSLKDMTSLDVIPMNYDDFCVKLVMTGTTLCDIVEVIR